MNDPREFPYVVETSPNFVGAKVVVDQFRNRPVAVAAVRTALSSGMDVLGIYVIRQISIEEFLAED